MAINLSKGQKLDLSKTPNLKRVKLCLGWKTSRSATVEYDLDASVFLLDERDVCVKDENFIFYNNLVSPCGGVKHEGDNLVGSDDGGDAEIVNIDLDKLSDKVHKISAVVSIFDNDGLGLHFGQIESSYIRLLNADTNELLANYDLKIESTGANVVIFGSLSKRSNKWSFCAEGREYNTGLDGVCKKYGLLVA